MEEEGEGEPRKDLEVDLGIEGAPLGRGSGFCGCWSSGETGGERGGGETGGEERGEETGGGVRGEETGGGWVWEKSVCTKRLLDAVGCW
jgi:hypothetical protein